MLETFEWQEKIMLDFNGEVNGERFIIRCFRKYYQQFQMNSTIKLQIYTLFIKYSTIN